MWGLAWGKRGLTMAGEASLASSDRTSLISLSRGLKPLKLIRTTWMDWLRLTQKSEYPSSWISYSVAAEERLTEVAVSPLPVVGGGAALALAVRGGGGGGRAAGWGVFVGAVGDRAGSHPRQGQGAGCASVTALLQRPRSKGCEEEWQSNIGTLCTLHQDVIRFLPHFCCSFKAFTAQKWKHYSQCLCLIYYLTVENLLFWKTSRFSLHLSWTCLPQSHVLLSSTAFLKLLLNKKNPKPAKFTKTNETKVSFSSKESKRSRQTFTFN